MNASRAKGTAWETAVVNWLKDPFHRAERRTMAGAGDRGDITGLDGTVIEAKSVQAGLLSTVFNVGLKELQTEVDNDSAMLGLLCVKRPGKTSPEHAYWIIDPRSVKYVIGLVEADAARRR